MQVGFQTRCGDVEEQVIRKLAGPSGGAFDTDEIAEPNNDETIKCTGVVKGDRCCAGISRKDVAYVPAGSPGAAEHKVNGIVGGMYLSRLIDAQSQD